VSAAYVDSSFLIAILFGEPRARSLSRVLGRFDEIVAADLLVAEVLATAAREGVAEEPVLAALEDVSLVLPGRTLRAELREILGHGRLRGADLWHLACAMFVAGEARAELAFLSRDEPQRRLARRLGFEAP
jgi:predicted nucleic acid-binding protein